MRNYFILNGVDSRDYGVYISGQGTFSAPQKAYTFYNVPGRNGAILGDEHRLENIEVSYEAFIYSDFDKNIADFRSFLLSLDGYQKLTDSYHPDEYRYAVYQGPFEPTVERTNDVGSFIITFSCKPQRYLLSGDTEYYPMSGEVEGNPVYVNTGDISSFDISIALNYYNNHSTESRHGYNYAYGIELTADEETIWSEEFGEKVLEANITASGAEFTTIVESAPKTGWYKVDGYTSKYACPFEPTGTIKYATFAVFKANPYILSVGEVTYDETNRELVWITRLGLNTIDLFYEYINKASTVMELAETVTGMGVVWSNAPEFPEGVHYLEAVQKTRYAAGYYMYEIPIKPPVLSVQVSASNTLENPTPFRSKPLIRLYGEGTLDIDGITITVSDCDEYVDIDCEMMDCYEGDTNRNNDVAFSTYDFPELKPGDNTFSTDGDVTALMIKPRWWRV